MMQNTYPHLMMKMLEVQETKKIIYNFQIQLYAQAYVCTCTLHSW